MLPAEGKEEEKQADRNAEPDTRRSKRRLTRGGSRVVAVGKRLHRRTGLRVSCLPRGRLPGAPEPEYTRRRRTRTVLQGRQEVVAATPRCYDLCWNQASRGTWDHNPRSFVFKGRPAAAGMAIPAPWARGQTTFPTVRVNCAHEALRRRDVAVRHPATGPPISRRPMKGALRA